MLWCLHRTSGQIDIGNLILNDTSMCMLWECLWHRSIEYSNDNAKVGGSVQARCLNGGRYEYRNKEEDADYIWDVSGKVFENTS